MDVLKEKAKMLTCRFGVRGFSLVQVMVSSGILATIALAMMTVTVNQAAHIRYLEQKGEILETKNLISGAFQNSDVCSCQLNPNTTVDNFNDANLWFDSAIVDGSQSISVKKLKSGCAMAAPVIVAEGERMTTGLVVEKIDLVNLMPTSNANEWQGDWRLTWKSGTLDRVHRPTLIKGQRILVDVVSAASTLNHRLVSVCAAMGTQLRIEAGVGVVPTNCFPGPESYHPLDGSLFCLAGAPYKDIVFAVPFTAPPKVIVTLSGPSANSTLVPCSFGAMDQVGTDVLNVTTMGFRGRAWFSPLAATCGLPWANGTGPNTFDWVAIGN